MTAPKTPELASVPRPRQFRAPLTIALLSGALLSIATPAYADSDHPGHKCDDQGQHKSVPHRQDCKTHPTYTKVVTPCPTTSAATSSAPATTTTGSTSSDP